MTNYAKESSKASLHARARAEITKLLAGKGLQAKVFRGGAWLAGGSIAEQAFRFGRNMLLTRLLAPEAFGTMAIALSSASIIDTLLEAGVRQAIIQNPRGAENSYLNAAWWLAMGRGITFYIVVFAAAPWIAKFYGNPILLPVLRVALLSVLFESGMSSGANLAIKEMRLSKWAIINHGGALIGIVLTVLLSFIMPGVWALAIGYAAENAGRFILSYIVCPFFPSIRLDREAVRDLLVFSRGVFGLAFFSLIFLRTDVFVLGRLYSATNLGLYVMSIYLAQTPTSFIMNLQAQTLMPSFSQIRDDNSRVNRIVQKVSLITALFGMPALVFIIFSGQSLITLAYGQRYGSSAVFFVAASLVAFVNVLNGLLTIVFFSKGLPQLHRRAVIITAITMLLLVYPLAKLVGPVGAQIASFAAILLGFVFQLARIRKLTNLDLGRYCNALLKGAGIAVCSAIVSFAVRSASAVFSRPIPNIALGVTVCALAFCVSFNIVLQLNQVERKIKASAIEGTA